MKYTIQNIRTVRGGGSSPIEPFSILSRKKPRLLSKLKGLRWCSQVC